MAQFKKVSACSNNAGRKASKHLVTTSGLTAGPVIVGVTSKRVLKRLLKEYAPKMEPARFKRTLKHAKAGRIIQLLPYCFIGTAWISVYERKANGWTTKVDFFRLTSKELTAGQAALAFSV